jgi:hypothetical protein
MRPTARLWTVVAWLLLHRHVTFLLHRIMKNAAMQQSK